MNHHCQQTEPLQWLAVTRRLWCVPCLWCVPETIHTPAARGHGSGRGRLIEGRQASQRTTYGVSCRVLNWESRRTMKQCHQCWPYIRLPY